MRHRTRPATGTGRLPAVAAATLLVLAAWAGAETSGPYEILDAHYRALGGLELLKGERTIHLEADLQVAGLTGTLRHWESRPDRSRTEVDLGVFAQTTGDNAEQAWALDANGKLSFERDPNALARREVAVRLAQFEHLDPDSEIFTVTLEGFERVEGVDCHVVRISSSPDGTVRDWYIGADDLFLWKSVETRTDGGQIILFSDYRDVDGVLHAFRQDMEILPVGQQQTVSVTMLETNVEIDPSLFEPPASETRDYEFTDGGDFVEIPFRFIERHLFLPVVLQCRESLWVLDTGASMSVIDRSFAESLGLKVSGTIKGEGAGNMVEVAFTTLPAFGIDGVEFSEQQVAVIDIAPLFTRTSDLEVVGILGYDFLSRFVTRVDYANETLTLYEPSAFRYDGPGAVLDAPLSGNLFGVEATVDGVHSGRWMLDLGAGGMTFHAPYAREHGLAEREGIYAVGFGAGGRISHFYSRFATVEFGGHVVVRPFISIAGVGADVTGAFAETEKIGNLGNTLFRHFVLYLDYENQQVIVERGDDFDREFPWDRSGLQLWRPDGEEIEVLFVPNGTPAAEAGFREGDAILAVNGIDVEHLGGLTSLRALLREDPGTEYVFRIAREGTESELKLVLRELL